MPDMLAHYDVAQAARSRLGAGRLADLLAAAPDAYAAGAQGPDFLFYAHVWSRGARNHLSLRVHQSRSDEVVAAMLAYCAAAAATDQPALYAYTCGYSAHVCLDAAAHPWVLYWTGDVSRGTDSDEGARAMRRHGILEASIDVMFAARHQPPGFQWRRSRRLLSLAPPRRQAIATMWSQVTGEVHGMSFTQRETVAALRDMAFVYGSMTDRRSPLSLLLSAGGSRLDSRGLVRTQIYPAAPHPAAVRLLTQRAPWNYPSRPDERRAESFADICDGAADDTVACLRAIEAAIGGDGVHAAVAAVGDRNMITGVPCGDPAPLVAFAPEPDELWRDA